MIKQKTKLETQGVWVTPGRINQPIEAMVEFEKFCCKID